MKNLKDNGIDIPPEYWHALYERATGMVSFYAKKHTFEKVAGDIQPPKIIKKTDTLYLTNPFYHLFPIQSSYSDICPL